jgi:hypothetical protein
MIVTAEMLTEKNLTFGYGEEVLKVAFEKIRPQGNWKMPIYAVIDEKDFEVCDAAACFYTGGGLTWLRKRKGGKVLVSGAGYYQCVGA